MVSDSIIVGVVVGMVVALASGYVSHYLRKGEMEALWAEERRRRKSDRRRELYDRELKTVSDAVQAAMEAIAAREGLAWLDEKERVKWLADLGGVGHMLDRALMTAFALRDDDLIERCDQLIVKFQDWSNLVHTPTGKVLEGKELEFEDLELAAKSVAADVARRIGEILEEV